jgi:hypothetical protein
MLDDSIYWCGEILLCCHKYKFLKFQGYSNAIQSHRGKAVVPKGSSQMEGKRNNSNIGKGPGGTNNKLLVHSTK